MLSLLDEAPPDAPPELGCALELEPDDGAALELEELESLLLGLLLLGVLLDGDEELLAPPDAEPELDFEASLEDDAPGVEDDDPPGVTLPEALDELEPGAVAPVPPEELDELGELDGDDGLLLELDEPGLDEVRPALSPHAARPKAIATAKARLVSFMLPPWLG